jgi:hypothetical protein
MASLEHNSPEPQQDSVSGASTPPKGPWAIAKGLWQQMLDDLPEEAGPIFADPPSSRIEDLCEYIKLVRLTLARIDCSDLISLLCAHDLVQDLWQQRALRRCGQAKIESEMRPAARALLQELLNDGQRSPEEILKLANQYVYLAFKSQPGLAEVRRVVPAFEMRPVEAEAIRRSLDAMESLSKLQALVGTQRSNAIENLKCAVDAAADGLHALEELLSPDSETAKKTATPQQTKQ